MHNYINKYISFTLIIIWLFFYLYYLTSFQSGWSTIFKSGGFWLGWIKYHEQYSLQKTSNSDAFLSIEISEKKGNFYVCLCFCLSACISVRICVCYVFMCSFVYLFFLFFCLCVRLFVRTFVLLFLLSSLIGLFVRSVHVCLSLILLRYFVFFCVCSCLYVCCG